MRGEWDEWVTQDGVMSPHTRNLWTSETLCSVVVIVAVAAGQLVMGSVGWSCDSGVM